VGGGYGCARGWWWSMRGLGSKSRRSRGLWAAGLRGGWSGRRAPELWMSVAGIHVLLI